MFAIAFLTALGGGLYAILSMDTKEEEPIVSKNLKKCKLDGEDLYNNKLFDTAGTLITSQPETLTCDNCGKYYYKENGKCVQLELDNTETGLCTAGLGQSGPCPF